MKKCSYCGKSYPDETAVCLIDGNSLEDISTSIAPVQPVVESQPLRKTIRRASIVSGAIFLFIVSNFARSGMNVSWIMAGSLAFALLSCAVAVMVVFLFSRRSQSSWSWVKVVPVTVISYLVFTRLAIIAIGIVVDFLRKGI